MQNLPVEDSLRVIACPHPFEMANKEYSFAPSISVAQILKEVQPDEFLRRKAHIWVNDEFISVRDWESTFPKAGSHIDIRVVPSGAVGRIIGMIFLAIAMIVISVLLPPVLIGMGGLWAAYAGVITAVTVMAVGIVGNLVLNALCPPAAPKLGGAGGPADSPTFALQGASNVTNLYGPIPKTFGKYRICPNNGARTYTETIGDKQYLHLYFVWGWGPIQIEDLRIGQTPIENFPNVDIVHSNLVYISSDKTQLIGTSEYSGVPTSPAEFWEYLHAVFSGQPLPTHPVINETFPTTVEETYPVTIKEEAIAIRLITNQENIRSSKTNADKLSIDITCPGGLASFDQKGNMNSYSCSHTVHYKLESDENWIYQSTLVLTGNTKSAVRETREWVVPRPADPEARYEIRVIRTTKADDQYLNSVSYWDVIRTTTNEDPLRDLPQWLNPNTDPPELAPRKLAVTSMRIMATGQLSGTVSEFSAVVTSICPDWDKGAFLTIAIHDAGVGYEANQLLLVVQSGGSGGLIKVVAVDGSGAVTECSIWHGGYLYTVAVDLPTTPKSGTGTGFTVDILTISAGAWVYRATQNPASLYREAVQGQQCHKPLPNSRLDLERLQYWHEYCSANKTVHEATEVAHPWQYNKNVDYQIATKDLLAEIASAGRASFAWVDSKLGVIIDEPQTFTKGPAFTPRNILKNSFQATIVYPDLPHAFRVPFRNEDKEYLLDERLVLDDGYLIEGKDAWGTTKTAGSVFMVHNPGTEEEWTQYYEEAAVFEQIDLPGVTHPDLVFKHARYHIATARLRPETTQFGTDFEWLVATRGDRIKFAHDVMLVGLTWGRVKDLVFEDIIGYEPGAIWNFIDELIDSSGNGHTLTWQPAGFVPVDASTQGAWNFLSALTDSSGKGHTLTWQGGGSPSYTTGLMPGTTAVVLDGSHYLSVADHADFNMGTGDFSLEIIAKITTLGKENTFCEKTDGVNGYWLWSNVSNILVLTLFNGGVQTHFSIEAITDNNYHYYGFSVDRDGNIVYSKDGGEYSQPASATGDLDNTAAFEVGSITGALRFTGNIDLVRVHKGVALTTNQMRANYASLFPTPSYTTGLLPGTTAVVLDGSHYMSVASHADFNVGTGDFTIEAIVKSVENAAMTRTIIGKVNYNSAYEGYIFAIVDGRPCWWTSDGANMGWMDSYLNLPNETNYHYIAISFNRDGDIITCVNDTFYNIAMPTRNDLDCTYPVCIGAMDNSIPAGTNVFKGDIDLVHFHKGVALTAQQMADNYASFLAGTNPVAEPIYDVNNISGVVTDEFIPMQDGKDYVARFRLSDPSITEPDGLSNANRSLLCPLENQADTVAYGQYPTPYTFGSGVRYGQDLTPLNEVKFADPITPSEAYPHVGDLFLFGEVDREAIDLVVKSIQPNSDLSATVTAVSYNTAIYDSDQGLIPAFESMMTLPSEWWLPIVDNVRSGGDVLLWDTGELPVIPLSSDPTLIRSADGSWISRILLTLYIPSLLDTEIIGVEARYGPTLITGYYDEAMTLPTYGDGIVNPVVLPVVDIHSKEVSLLPVVDGTQYSYQLRYVKKDSTRGGWTPVATHLVEGKSAPPQDVSGFAISQVSNFVTATWVAVDDLDVAGYEVRYGEIDVEWPDDNSLGSTNFLNRPLVTTFTTSEVPSGTWDFLIKAIDTSGNYSNIATRVQFEVYPFTVILSEIQQFPVWPGTLVNFIRNPATGNLNPDSQNVASANNFDLFDSYVDTPYAESSYVAPEIDLGSDEIARMFARITTNLHPDAVGETNNSQFWGDYDLTLGYPSYNGYEEWGVKNFTGRYVLAKVAVDNTLGVCRLTRFKPTIDKSEAV